MVIYKTQKTGRKKKTTFFETKLEKEMDIKFY